MHDKWFQSSNKNVIMTVCKLLVPLQSFVSVKKVDSWLPPGPTHSTAADQHFLKGHGQDCKCTPTTLVLRFTTRKPWSPKGSEGGDNIQTANNGSHESAALRAAPLRLCKSRVTYTLLGRRHLREGKDLKVYRPTYGTGFGRRCLPVQK